MPENIKKKEFVSLLAQKMKVSNQTAEKWIDAFSDTLFECFKQQRGVVITNLVLLCQIKNKRNICRRFRGKRR